MKFKPWMFCGILMLACSANAIWSAYLGNLFLAYWNIALVIINAILVYLNIKMDVEQKDGE